MFKYVDLLSKKPLTTNDLLFFKITRSIQSSIAFKYNPTVYKDKCDVVTARLRFCGRRECCYTRPDIDSLSLADQQLRLEPPFTPPPKHSASQLSGEDPTARQIIWNNMGRRCSRSDRLSRKQHVLDITSSSEIKKRKPQIFFSKADCPFGFM